MARLIPEDDGLQAWDPQTGPCCTPATFKLNLGGTPRDDWNMSASRVFADDFLATHSDLYPDTWDIRQTVLEKSQARIKSLIRLYRRQFIGADVLLQMKIAQRRQERKTNVSHLHLVVIISWLLFVPALPSSQRHNVLVPTDGATASHARGFGCRR